MLVCVDLILDQLAVPIMTPLFVCTSFVDGDAIVWQCMEAQVLAIPSLEVWG